jgi:flagellar protein FliL
MTATATATVDVPPTPAKGRKKLLLVAGVVVLVLVGGGAFLLLGSDAEAEEEVGTVIEEGPVVPVADMTANLAGSQIHFAKLSFAAVLTPDADAKLVGERFPLLRDAAITELSTMPAEHLRTTAGMDELRSRLSGRASDLYPDGEILRIVLTELLVQ